MQEQRDPLLSFLLPGIELPFQQPANRRRWRAIRLSALVFGIITIIVMLLILFRLERGWPFLTYREDSLSAALSFMISCFFGLLVWVWTWLSYVTGNESQHRMERSWPGRQIRFENISEHIYEFRRELLSERLVEVDQVDMMLSTLAYGIEDKVDPGGTIAKLADSLLEWARAISEAPGDRNVHVLRIRLWNMAAHRAVWSLSGAIDEPWTSGRDEEEILSILRGMLALCRMFRYVANEGKEHITVTLTPVAVSDLRLFAIRRRKSGPFGMMVTITPFVDHEHRKSFLHTGFITPSNYGCERLVEMANSFATAADDDLLHWEHFRKNPENYFTRFFDLPLEWAKNPEEVARKLHESPPAKRQDSIFSRMWLGLRGFLTS